MRNFFRIKKFIYYLISAQTKYWIHSPFVFDFMMEIVLGGKVTETKRINKLRSDLKRNFTQLDINDFGAGYGNIHHSSIKKTVSEIVKSSARSKKSGDLFHRFIKKYQPKYCLEFGTNLGFSASYIASALVHELITVEADQNLVKIAQNNLNILGINNCRIINTTFDDFLIQIQSYFSELDFVFIDGNHTFDATKNYVETLIPLMNNNSVIILDDIYWSEQMNEAWKYLIRKPEVNVSIDLYHLGFLFFNREQTKQDFRLLKL